MALHWHPAVDQPTEAAFEMDAPVHRSRLALERVLADPADTGAWHHLVEIYDDQAVQWTEWARSQRWYVSPVRAGLANAKPVPWAFEVGCGTGQATAPLAAMGRVLASDVNQAMIERAPRLPGVTYLLGDVRALPLATGSVRLLVGLNSVPHIREFERVIAADGQLLWCSSFAAGTPLYIEPERLLALFGPGWQGEAGRAGHGDWVLLRRR